MIPAVTVPPRPNGLPTATTQSPTRVSLAAKETCGKSLPSVTLTSARSVLGSVPITLAVCSVPLSVTTFTSVAFSTTWLLVTT